MMGRASTTSPILNITSATIMATSEPLIQPPTSGSAVMKAAPWAIITPQLMTSRDVHSTLAARVGHSRCHSTPGRPRLRSAAK